MKDLDWPRKAIGKPETNLPEEICEVKQLTPSPETYMAAWNKLHQVLDERQEQEMLDLMDLVLQCVALDGASRRGSYACAIPHNTGRA